MDQARAFSGIAHVFQHRDQLVEIVAVDGADIEQAQFLKQRAAGPPTAREFLGAAGRFMKELRQGFDDLFRGAADALVERPGDEPCEV